MVRTIIGFVLALGTVGFFGWSLIYCLRKGEAGPKSQDCGLPAKRVEQPFRFWSFIAVYAGATLMFAAGAIFGITGGILNAGLEWLAVAATGWSVMFGAIAVLTALYTNDGFHTGRAIFFGQVTVSFSDRINHPREFWTSQITSMGMTAFCAVIALFPWAFVLWISAGSPTLW